MRVRAKTGRKRKNSPLHRPETGGCRNTGSRLFAPARRELPARPLHSSFWLSPLSRFFPGVGWEPLTGRLLPGRIAPPFFLEVTASPGSAAEKSCLLGRQHLMRGRRQPVCAAGGRERRPVCAEGDPPGGELSRPSLGAGGTAQPHRKPPAKAWRGPVCLSEKGRAAGEWPIEQPSPRAPL